MSNNSQNEALLGLTYIAPCLPTALGDGALSRIAFLHYFRVYLLRFFYFAERSLESLEWFKTNKIEYLQDLDEVGPLKTYNILPFDNFYKYLVLICILNTTSFVMTKILTTCIASTSLLMIMILGQILEEI